jgi:hypothetical protein
LSRPIGYYIHHHGHGHRQRAIAIGQSLDDVMLMGTGLAGRTGNLPFLDLPDDRLDASFAGIDHADRPASLHYAPLDHEGIRQRIRRMAGWIAEARPRLMVVDVSAEVAMLARLASVPTVYVRLSGNGWIQPIWTHFVGLRGCLRRSTKPWTMTTYRSGSARKLSMRRASSSRIDTMRPAGIAPCWSLWAAGAASPTESDGPPQPEPRPHGDGAS